MKTELSSIRLKLEQMRRQLIEELERLLVDSSSSNEQPRMSSFYSREETVDSTSNLERQVALERQKRNNLAEVEHALQKLEEGSYGICEKCGQPIALARLEALPHATFCVKCSDCKK
ncbi:MAG: TraR/DksA C4-type zinc finger protein [Dehalococcoidales bacterium]|nr:TraR/DksA C4-type zinc finger protein [Dehalococcoidales bacterium]